MFDLTAAHLSFLFIGLFIVIIVLLAFTKNKQQYPYFPREFLLTKAEQKFYGVLKAITKNKFDIACKVRLADIINCNDMN